MNSDQPHEAQPPTQYLVIRNADTSFVYFSKPNGPFPPVPAQDREGNAHDFNSGGEIGSVSAASSGFASRIGKQFKRVVNTLTIT